MGAGRICGQGFGIVCVGVIEGGEIGIIKQEVKVVENRCPVCKSRGRWEGKRSIQALIGG